jgi:anti-sigma factor RsiW
MNDARKDDLIKLSMRRELSPEERSALEAEFAVRPELRAAWEEERALSRALQSLPDVPVSSNFTAQVLLALDAEARPRRRHGVLNRDWLARLWPRVGLGALALGLAFVGGQQWYEATRHEKYVRDVSFAAADLASMPNAELLLRDFDAIRELGQISTVAASSDDELLRALQ